MPLATKNGAIIVKNGSLAQNCNCCSSQWYCCENPTCALKDVKSITVELNCTGYMLQRRYQWQCRSYVGGTVSHDYYVSTGFDGAALNGVRFLQKQSDTVWSTSVPMTGGCSSTITATIIGTLLNVEVVVYASAWQKTDQESYRSLSQLSCGTVGNWQGQHSAAGDEATQTMMTSGRVILDYYASASGCYEDPSPARLPYSFTVSVPYIGSPTCTEAGGSGVVSTNLETGSQRVEIKAVTLTRN